MNETIETQNIAGNEELGEVFVPSEDSLIGWGAMGNSGGFSGE